MLACPWSHVLALGSQEEKFRLCHLISRRHPQCNSENNRPLTLNAPSLYRLAHQCQDFAATDVNGLMTLIH
jgi:hypothetical protein